MNEIKERYVGLLEKQIEEVEKKINTNMELLEFTFNENIANDNRYQNLLHKIEDMEALEGCQKICRDLHKARVHRRWFKMRVPLLRNLIDNYTGELAILKESLKFYTNHIYIPRPETVKGVIGKKEKINNKKVDIVK